MKKEMRRNEKAMSQEESLEVLEQVEYGVLSTISTDDTPYGVPMNFTYEDGALYFHCAKEGHRLENLEANSSACFNVVGSVKLLPEKFNTEYRSVTIFGTVRILEDREEKKKGITAIAERLAPEHREAGLKYINSAFENMHVLKMDISHMTGKATRG